jgi:hypothetical protein
MIMIMIMIITTVDIMITIKPMAGYGIIIMLWNNDNSSKT